MLNFRTKNEEFEQCELAILRSFWRIFCIFFLGNFPPRPNYPTSMNQYRSSQMPPYGNQGSFPDFPRQPLPPNSSSSNSTASRSAQARHGPPPGAVPVQPPGPPGNLTPLPPNQSQPPPGTPKSLHTVRNLHFLSKNTTLTSRKNCRFFWVKNSWKCCGFGLFSCWQLWFHEKNCRNKNPWKCWGFVKIEFWTKIWLFRIIFLNVFFYQ